MTETNKTGQNITHTTKARKLLLHERHTHTHMAALTVFVYSEVDDTAPRSQQDTFMQN